MRQIDGELWSRSDVPLSLGPWIRVSLQDALWRWSHVVPWSYGPPSWSSWYAVLQFQWCQACGFPKLRECP